MPLMQIIDKHVSLLVETKNKNSQQVM